MFRPKKYPSIYPSNSLEKYFRKPKIKLQNQPLNLYDSDTITKLSKDTKLNKIVKDKTFITLIPTILRDDIDYAGGKFYQAKLLPSYMKISKIHKYRKIPKYTIIKLSHFIVSSAPYTNRYDHYNLIATISLYPQLTIDVTDIFCPPEYLKSIKTNPIKTNPIKSVNYNCPKTDKTIVKTLYHYIDFLNNKLNNPIKHSLR